MIRHKYQDTRCKIGLRWIGRLEGIKIEVEEKEIEIER